MNSGSNDSGSTAAYLLGHSDREIERLKVQARLIDPVTKRIFEEAGIVPGMRVLDVGSGAGDVAFLAADIVGESGMVIGVDRVAAAMEVARSRATERSMRNVEFRVGDPAEMRFEQPFDAAIGRYVLQFQQQPELMLRQLAAQVRSGGLLVFHEIDWSGLASFPPAPIYDAACRWGLETLRLHGTETRMGSRLHAAFVKAGLAAPAMRLEALVGGGEQSTDILRLIADLVATLLPEMSRLGVADPAAVGVESLFDRMHSEAIASTGVYIGHLQIGAWARTDYSPPTGP